MLQQIQKEIYITTAPQLSLFICLTIWL